MSTARPNLGYSNYHWINLDIRRAIRSRPAPKETLEELEPATPIPTVLLVTDLELSEDAETETETCFMFHSRQNKEEKVEKDKGPLEHPSQPTKGPIEGPSISLEKAPQIAPK